jgi:hypothetical protein
VIAQAVDNTGVIPENPPITRHPLFTAGADTGG